MRKTITRPAFHVFIWSALAVYLALVDPVYTRLFLRVGKPVSVEVLDRPDSAMDYSFDQLEELKYAGEDVYSLTGWAVPRASDVPLEAFEKQVVLIDERAKGYVFAAQTTRRDDVAASYPEEREADRAGFSAFISNLTLPLGAYRIGILYSDGRHSPVFHATEMYVVRSPNNLTLVPSYTALDDSTDDWIEKFRLLAGLQGVSAMACDIDRLQTVGEAAEGIYQLDGWAFPWDGRVPLEQVRKRVVLLDERSMPHLLDAQLTVRPDVQQAFAEQAGDVERSGFSARLSPPMLQPGVYRLGILYTDRQSSSVYCLTNTSLQRTSTALHLVPSTSALDGSIDGWIEGIRISTGLQDDTPMACDLDRLQIVGEEAGDIYQLDGWAFSWDGSVRLEEVRKRIVLLDERSVPYLLDAQSTVRPDVQQASAAQAGDVELSGFSARLSASMLQPGVYRLGILYTDRQSSSVYCLTSTSLQRTTTALHLIPSTSALDDSIDDWMEKARILAGLRVETLMASDIDHLQIVGEEAGDIYQLDGWAFPWDGSVRLEEVRKRIVLLDERSMPHLLDAQSTLRPDVQRASAAQAGDVELSGFSARLSPSMLQPGVYRLGILYTDRQSSSVYHVTDQCLLWTLVDLSLLECEETGG